MSRISNYEELVAERRRVEFIIAEKKQIIHDRIEDIKDKVAPLVSVLAALKILKTNQPTTNNNSLLKVGSSVAIDLLVGQRLLKNASWLTKLVVPPLLKAVSSRLIGRVKKN
jgi:hypothetical protein